MYSKFNFPSLDETVSWLAELENRDKVIRLLTYLSTLVGTSSRVVNILKVDPVEFEKSAKIFSSKLSETRRILRFFDDLPMLRFTLYYGLGEKQHESDSFQRWMDFVKNLVDQLYYPADHLGWLNETGICKIGRRVPWTSISILLWGTSLVLNIIKNSRKFKLISKRDRQANCNLNKRKSLECFLTLLQNMADLINAINWIPRSWLGPFPLWSERLTSRQAAVMGTFSSAISLYKATIL